MSWWTSRFILESYLVLVTYRITLSKFSQWVSSSQCIMHMWVLTPKSHVMCVCVSTHGLIYREIFNGGQVLKWVENTHQLSTQVYISVVHIWSFEVLPKLLIWHIFYKNYNRRICMKTINNVFVTMDICSSTFFFHLVDMYLLTFKLRLIMNMYKG